MNPVSKIDRYVIERVKKRRRALKYSQAALSYALDISAGYVGQVESEVYDTRYSLERLNEIARVLKCVPSTIFYPNIRCNFF